MMNNLFSLKSERGHKAEQARCLKAEQARCLKAEQANCQKKSRLLSE
jgi:hypothetical protein